MYEVMRCQRAFKILLCLWIYNRDSDVTKLENIFEKSCIAIERKQIITYC